MASKVSDIETTARQRLLEITPNFWTSDELTDIIVKGIKDLWRDIVDLKQEHYLTINNTDVFYDASTTTLRGVPADVHKVYMIEPVNSTANGTNAGLRFRPLDYNHRLFQYARTIDPIDPTNDTVYYCITQQGAPVGPPVILCAPKVTSQVAVSFTYVPTLPTLNTNSAIPIPGEADSALVAWTVAYARAKEADDRSPDGNWLSIYATEKQHLLQSLGLRQYQEPLYTDAEFEEYWA